MDWSALSLHLEDRRGTNIAWRIVSTLLKYRKMRIADAGFQGRLASGAISLEQLKFALAGGTLDASGSANNVAGVGHVAVRAALSGFDAGQLSRLAGAEAAQIAGRLDGGAALDMTGDTVKSALKASRGHVVLAVTQAHVARDLIEKASTDLRSLFRRREGVVKVTCLLGVVDLRNGIGTIWPLRLRTPDGTLDGHGHVDFLRQRLDLTIQSVSASTSFFAMDVPVSVSGDFRNLHVRPVIGPSAASTGNDPLHDVPQEMRPLAERNLCLR
jgi:AsmA family protein